MKIKNLLKVAGLAGMMALMITPVSVSAEESEAYPTLYEDGTVSPVSSGYDSIGTQVIFANGTSLIFKDGIMYQDFEPYGVLDENDKHIYSSPYVESLKDDEMFSGKCDMDLSMTYLDTGGVDDTQYGDCSIYIENTTFRGVSAKNINNASINIKNSNVLRNYIDNATGNVDYNIENSEIQEHHLEAEQTVQGNVNITYKNVHSEEGISAPYIMVSGTVLGNTKIVVNDSILSDIIAAWSTGSDTQTGNVYVEANDSTIDGIWGVGAGYATSEGKVNGDISINVNNCTIQYGIKNFATNKVDGNNSVITGKGTVYAKNSDIDRIEDFYFLYNGKSYPFEQTVSDRTYVTVEDSKVNTIQSNEVDIKGTVEATVDANRLKLEQGCKFVGAGDVYEKLSGTGNWYNEASISLRGDSPIEEGTLINIVPFKKENGQYIPYGKNESFVSVGAILFEKNDNEVNKNINPEDYMKNFKCDNYEMTYEKTNVEIYLLNYCPNHDWKKCDASGYQNYYEYAQQYDIQATCTKAGLINYYCTLCGRFDAREIAPLGHNYVEDKRVEPTKTEKGYTVYKCLRCGDSYKDNYVDALIYDESERIDIGPLNFSKVPSYTYTGKEIKPSITVSDGKKKLKINKDYILTYENNKDVGTAKLNVIGRGKYKSGRQIEFQIIPKATKVSSIKSSKKKIISLKWKRNSKVTGYIIQYSTDKNFKKNVKKITVSKNKTTSTQIKKLKSKKTYYVRVATYKKVQGKKYISKYSGSKKIRVK